MPQPSQKLNQVIAVEKGTKNRVMAEIDQIDKAFQKSSFFEGFHKAYRKKDEADEDVPPQRQNVQVKAQTALSAVQERLSFLMDVTAAKDLANTRALSTLELDGVVIAENLPATYLLFLEKQLTDLHTLVGRIPTLDPAELWFWDAQQQLFRTEPALTSRTKKVWADSSALEEPLETRGSLEMNPEGVGRIRWPPPSFHLAWPTLQSPP